MNPFPVIFSILKRNPLANLLFAGLIGAALALALTLSLEERALRRASAAASERFDLIVGAPGSQIALLMSVVYLRPDPGPLLDAAMVSRLLGDADIAIAAPIGFGDSYRGIPILGTIAPFITHLSGELAEGRLFTRDDEALIGAKVALDIGTRIRPAHGPTRPDSEALHPHGEDLAIVGRMKATGTPWDRAIIVPIEQVWAVHGLAAGRPPESDRLGPPFDASQLSGVPAFVVIAKDKSVARAYALRQRYRGVSSTAFFPAEILVQLYAFLGDARQVMSLVAMAGQALVLAAILAAILAILQFNRKRLAILRALGASRRYVLLVIWGYVLVLLAAGIALGLAGGWALASVLAAFFSQQTGIVAKVALGWEEIWLGAATLGLGALLGLIPAIALYRRPLADALRD